MGSLIRRSTLRRESPLHREGPDGNTQSVKETHAELKWPGLSRQKKGLFKVDFCLVFTADTERRA